MTLTYKQAGVDIDAKEGLIERIKPLARSTRIAEVVADVGGFAGLCRIPDDIEEPLLVSGTDGVGTKLKLAFATGQHGTIGQDLVAMCVNDVLTTGARPLFFLDYFACGKLDVAVAESVIAGIAEGCKLAGCALLGGETAELPGMYPDGEYDLAGFAVGVVAKKAVLGPARVRPGDALIAISSSGLHSNGYSLARRVLNGGSGALASRVDELGETLAEALLRPTKIYARVVAALTRGLETDLHVLCHVTGGGIVGNLPRVLPPGTLAKVGLPRPWPALFELIVKRGPIAEPEMHRTFNLGVGLIAVVAAARVNDAISIVNSAGETGWRIGAIEAAGPDVPASAQIVAGSVP